MKPASPLADSRQALVAMLRRQVERLEGPVQPQDERPISTGSPDLDRLVAEGGLRRGSLTEYLAAEAGGGAGMLALAAAREACADGRTLVVVDRPRQFYPPAASAYGLKNLLLVRPASEADELWALDQALRCPGVGAVWIRCGSLDVREFRRLQLAAESGGTLGLLVRPARLRGQPTWAEVQWLVEPATLPTRHSPGTRRLRVELIRCRGGTRLTGGGRAVHLELDRTTGLWRQASDDHATHSLPASAGLAHPATSRRQSRA